MSFDGLIPALQTKKVDVVIAGMSVTSEREKAVSFSIPCLTFNVTFLANKNHPINGEEKVYFIANFFPFLYSSCITISI